jgi:HEAT repeat protein
MSLRGTFSVASIRVARLTRDGNVAGLIQAMRNERVWEARVNAAFSLAKIGDKSAVPHLIEVFNDPDPNVRWSAVFALRSLRATEARELFEAALTDEAPVVRQGAARALGWIGAVDSLPVLRHALDSDPDDSVRFLAAESLLVLGDKSTRANLPAILETMPWRIRRSPHWKHIKRATDSGDPLAHGYRPYKFSFEP